MQKSLAVLNSDQLNRYNMWFSIGALESGLWGNAGTGMPMHLSHDMHKPVGWMLPFGLHFQPGLVRSLAISMIPDSEEEGNLVSTAKKNHLIEQTTKEIKKYGADFYPHIKPYVSENFKYIEVGTLAAVEIGMVERMFAYLLELKDKNGLIEISKLLEDFEYKEQGVFFHRKLPVCIFAHQYFRKSLSRHNNFHFFFLDELLRVSKKDNVKTKIAIDWDMIGYSPSFYTSFEFEYWYGPKFNNDISAIQPGLTRHQTSEYERMFHGISSTEFFWKINDDLHEFELEELKEDMAPTLEDTYACRYIHSIYSDTEKTFVHFDGAIRAYDTELYFERIDKKMTEFGRRSQYKKLFRVDGQLDLNDWKSLSLNYMQGNPLIHEYFGEDRQPHKIKKNEKEKSVKQRFVPFSIDSGDGIRMLLSYHGKNTDYTNSHTVSIFDIFGIGDERMNIIDYDIVEVKKALERQGKTLVIPEGVLFKYTKDRYWNIPCIFHGVEDPQTDLNVTINALKQIVDALIKKERETVISFTLAWNMEDKEVRISMLGHVNDLSNWFSEFQIIPTNRVELIKWIEKQRDYLNKSGASNPNVPELEDICQLDGVLYMKRKVVSDEFKPDFIKEENGVAITFEIPDNDKELYEEMMANNIRPVLTGIIMQKTCLKTNLNYLESPFSKILDDDIITSIDKIEHVHVQWSDKAYD